jgi:hypothetical protein
MQPKIPTELEAEVMARSAYGQSDAAIVEWLARLDPPIRVHRLTILRLRHRLGELPEGVPEAAAASHKPSGAQGRTARAEEAARETADHAARGGATVFEYALDFDAIAGHHKVLRLLDQGLRAVAADKVMTLAEKLRWICDLSASYSRLKVDAEIQAEQDEIRRLRKLEQARMDSLRAELEREQRRLAAERRDLEEQRRQLTAKQ